MIKHDFKRKYSCRLCKSKKLKTFHKYNKSPLCDEYLKTPKKQFFYPMTLQICQKCKFVQLNTVVEPSSIYDNYLYFTKSSINLKKHFQNYARDILTFLKIKNKIRIMDIGSNDGMLLSFFKKYGHTVFGVEPFKDASLAANKKKILNFNSYFDKKFLDKFLATQGKVDIICVNNLYANIDNLHIFTNQCNKILNNYGFLIIESSYLFDMLDKNIFDFVYHEHLSYFSIIPLKNFMKKCGFELLDLKKTDSKGGSMRYIFQKIDHPKNSKLLKKFMNLEKQNYQNINNKQLTYQNNIKNLRLKFDLLFKKILLIKLLLLEPLQLLQLFYLKFKYLKKLISLSMRTHKKLINFLQGIIKK